MSTGGPGLAALAGSLVVWIPVLAYYVVHGMLARFLPRK